MTDLQPCLAGCDQALAEADLLITALAGWSETLDPELASVRARIAALRLEVERLRGMPSSPKRKRIKPEWTKLAGTEAPWPPSGRDLPTSP